MKEAKTLKRNIYTVWLDYQKAFDSVTHEWLIRSLKLAKVPQKLISAIEQLTKQWATIASLHGTNETIITEIIKFLNGIFQGDTLSVLLFVLCLNPLSFLLQKLKGYSYGKNRNHTITHNFFVDDLKLYASSLSILKKQLELVTKFSKDIGMKFGQDKCAYIRIEKGKNTTSSAIVMNGLTIKPIQEGESYRYLGQDENIAYEGKINKERVTKEYLSRVRKIWSSELSAYNKTIAHNSFAIPVITPTVGILDWTKEEIKNIDIRTRKILSVTGNFHPNSDVDRLYIGRNVGGRGLRSCQGLFESRIVALKQHLHRSKNRNQIMNYVYCAEIDNIIRVGNELIQKYNIVPENEEMPKATSKKFSKEDTKSQYQKYSSKVMHGYFNRTIEKDENLDQNSSKSWTKNRKLTSHFEGYISAIQEQEIPTKYLINKRARDSGKEPPCNNKCRLCKTNVEDVIHVISGCKFMSARYYLPMRHDMIAKSLYKEIIRKNHPEIETPEEINEQEYIQKIGNNEYWWNLSINTAQKVQHNKPDLVIWNKNTKTCDVIEFSCPADINVSRKEEEKISTYIPFVRNLQIMHPNYHYRITPIIVGAHGSISKSLHEYVCQLGFNNFESKRIINKLQSISATGTAKICKSFLKFL